MRPGSGNKRVVRDKHECVCTSVCVCVLIAKVSIFHTLQNHSPKPKDEIHPQVEVLGNVRGFQCFAIPSDKLL